MNLSKKEIEDKLIAILNDSKKLEDSKLTPLNYELKVDKDLVFDFKNLCGEYFKLEFNQFPSEQVDYVTIVGNLIKDKMKNEKDASNLSKAYDLSQSLEGELEKFHQYVSTINDINRNLASKIKIENDFNTKLLEGNINEEELKKLRTDKDALIQGRNNLKNNILLARTNINNILIQALEKELDSNNEYTREEYNSIDTIISILKVANNVEKIEDLVIYKDCMVITKDQSEVMNQFYSKVTLFKYLDKPIKEIPKEVTNKDKNEEIINQIKNELTRMENDTSINEEKVDTGIGNNQKIYAKDKEEYQRLIKILNYLHRANNSKQLLVPTWISGYVLSSDKHSFEKLLSETNLFKNSNPNLQKIEKNQKLIQELYAYLDTLASDVKNYSGVTKITKNIGDRVWDVPGDWHYEEANAIIEMIRLLERQEGSLVDIWDVAYVGYRDTAKFKSLINATRKFSDKVPVISNNEEEKEKLMLEFKKLMEKAMLNPGEERISASIPFLKKDEEEYKLLEEKRKYLEHAKISENLVSIDGVEIDDRYAKRYHEINLLLENLKKKNESLSDSDSQELNSSKSDDATNPIEGVSTSESGVEKASENIDRGPTGLMPYVAPVESLTPYNPKKEEEPVSTPTFTSDETTSPKPRKKVVSVRKLANDSLKYIKENWKKIVALGLCLGIASLTLTELAPIIIYANSCNALALPGLAGFFNTLSSLVASLSNIHFLNGAWIASNGTIINLGAASSKSLAATTIALSGLGIVGGSFAFANKILKSGNNDRLPNPKEQHSVIEKLKQLARNLSIKGKEQNDNLVQNISSNEDALFQEIAKNVENKIEAETEDATKRIEDRVANLEQEIPYEDYSLASRKEETGEIKHDVQTENKPVIEIPSDEEILETITDKKLVLAQTDQYIEKKKAGINSKKYRDLVFETTGIDLNDYNVNETEGIVEARSDVAHAMNLSKNDLINQISNKIRVLQSIIDNGLLPALELEQTRIDIDVLNNRIDNLQKNERGK